MISVVGSFFIILIKISKLVVNRLFCNIGVCIWCSVLFCLSLRLWVVLFMFGVILVRLDLMVCSVIVKKCIR